MIQYQNYWLANKRISSTSGEIPTEVDVLVIGGGINGVSTAYHLAKHGVSVLLLEQEFIGWGASGRNGGMVLTGLKEDVSALTHKYGLETAQAFFSASIESIDLVETIIGLERIDCGFYRSGHIEAASKQSHFERLVVVAEIMEKDFGHKVSIIPKRDLATELNSEAYFGGMLDTASGAINPYLYVIGLANAAKTAGAIILEGIKVEEIKRSGGKFLINAGGRTVMAEKIVHATSAYTSKKFPKLERKMAKIGSYILCTEALSEKLVQTLIPKLRMVFDTKNFLSYYRINSDNRLLFGGRAAFGKDPERSVSESVEVLRRGLQFVFPQLTTTRIDYAWGGTLDVTQSKVPAFAEIDGAVFTAGFAGHGVAIASLIGKHITNFMISKEKSIFFTNSLPNMPLYSLRDIYLPFVGYYYQIQDLKY
jgi:glycine/D-amino acid oxidase-like deaminating enzyme